MENEDAYTVRDIDPADEGQIMACLSAKDERYKLEKKKRKLDLLEVNVGLAQLEPWDPQLRLRPCYVMSTLRTLSSRLTRQGFWKVIDNDYAGRAPSDASSYSSPYDGVRLTLEFNLHGGIRTDWRMHEYHMAETSLPRLILGEDLVLRKVFLENEEPFPSPTMSWVIWIYTITIFPVLIFTTTIH